MIAVRASTDAFRIPAAAARIQAAIVVIDHKASIPLHLRGRKAPLLTLLQPLPAKRQLASRHRELFVRFVIPPFARLQPTITTMNHRLSTFQFIRLACLVVTSLSFSRGIAIAQTQSPAIPTSPETVDVFSAGRDGYNVFRIPAIIRAADGDLLAFCEARAGGDASEIDLVMKRSSDSGATWSKLQVVQESDDFKRLYGPTPPPITIGNPAPVVDLRDSEHPGRIWLPFTIENDKVFVAYSDDSGRTWASPREITPDVKRDNWGWYATGPVHSIQIQSGPYRGRLVIPANHRLGGAGKDAGPLGAHAILSDDHGATWRLGGVDSSYDDGLNANETTVVELTDGVLYFNTRDQNGQAVGTRGETWSHDGGQTFESNHADWAFFRPSPAELDPPVVQSALLRTQAGLILFSGPDENGPSGPGRSDLRIRISADACQTWRDGPLVHTGPAAYSDMIELKNGVIGVLFECGSPSQSSAYQHIRFRRVDLP